MKLNNSIIKVLLVLLSFTTFATSCKKGEPGPPGPQGTQGVAGANGNTILSGTGVPANTNGAVGDYYLDLSTSNLYGPKTTSGWGSSVSLKGAAGPNGNGILSGTGAPPATLGVNGDFYLDKTTYNLYGPKTTGNWGTPTSLVGPAGRVSYTELGLTDIASLESKMGTSPINGTNASGAIFTPENIFIFKTNENRYGKFRITQIDLITHKLSIVFTVYNSNGTAKIAEKALDVNSLQYMDFDAGLANGDANAQSADLRWARATTVQSYFEINNSTKLLQYK